MKRLLIFLFVTAFLSACNNEKKSETATASVKELAKISLPYEIEYKDMKNGDPNNVKIVLDFFKTWDENRLIEGRPFLNDSVAVNFIDGSKFEGLADSLLSIGNQIRASFSAVSTTVDAAMSVHSDSKKEDWVLIWNRTYNTDQNGKVDSMSQHSFWQIKNGKISFWGELEAKLAPAPMK